MSNATDTLRELVELCNRDGNIYGARPHRATKTLTVRGKRRIRIRLQTDICAALLGQVQNATPYYPDLWFDVCEIADDVQGRAQASVGSREAR
jgi:hypothetical protein